MFFPAKVVLASEESGAVASSASVKNANDSLGFDQNELQEIFETSESDVETLHSEQYCGDFKYTIDMNVYTPEPGVSTRASSSTKTKKGEGVFNCYYKNTTWVFTATLTATFNYNGTYAWTTYGYYAWESNSKAGFSQSITKNTYSSEKSKDKTKYVVSTKVYSNYGYLGLHTFKLICTPSGGLNIKNSVCF